MSHFKPFTYWAAFSNFGRAEDFPTKREAVDHVRRNGGGAVRKFRQLNAFVCSSRMDAIEIEAV